jgi:hypothetical protein
MGGASKAPREGVLSWLRGLSCRSFLPRILVSSLLFLLLFLASTGAAPKWLAGIVKLPLVRHGIIVAVAVGCRLYFDAPRKKRPATATADGKAADGKGEGSEKTETTSTSQKKSE